MKKRIVTAFFVFGIFLAFSINVIVLEKSNREYTITTPYEFPIEPGDKEWVSFSVQEMIEACQVPQHILEDTSTAALIETMLSNSFILQFIVFENSYSAMESLEENYNIFRELQSRPDYIEALSQIYEETSLLTSEELKKEKESERFFDVFNLEVLIAYEMYKSENGINQSNRRETDWTYIEKNYKEKSKMRAQENETYSINSDGFVWFKTFLHDR